MKFSTIAKAIQAVFSGMDHDFSKVVIDSRKIQPNDCFVAIKGEQFDGHHFLREAIEKGAVALMVDKPLPNDIDISKISVLQVEDTVLALGRLASYWRDQFTLPVIGITGSCAKTTTKGMLQSICQRSGKTLATQGNFNNQIGLPLTMLQLDSSYRYAVIEMGASAKGDIAYLGQIAKPTVSIITNIAPAHLAGFGSIEGVAQAKGEIYDALPIDGVAVLNTMEPFHSTWMPSIQSRRTITYGLSSTALVYATEIAHSPLGVAFTLHIEGKTARVELAHPGEHMVLNSLASVSAAHAIGISIEEIVEGLQSFGGVPGRLCRYQGTNGAKVIDDSYNANPGSMLVALNVLSACPGKTIFVMGDMAELGENAQDYHKQVGRQAKEKGITQLLAVGQLSELAVDAFGKGATWYASKEALLTELKKQLEPDVVVLIKGSRSSQMDIITKAIMRQEGASC